MGEPMDGVIDVQRLTLNPGDRLVLTCKGPLTDDALRRLTATVEREFPGHRAIVLDETATLQVIGPPDVKPPPPPAPPHPPVDRTNQW